MVPVLSCYGMIEPQKRRDGHASRH
jgi:hypothetical protein